MNKISYRFQIFVLMLLFGVLFSCKTASLESMNAQSMLINDSIAVDSNIIRITEPYRKQLDSSMKQVIGYSEKSLEKGTPEGLLGNFLCDALYSVINRDLKDSLRGYPLMILLNNGGLRTSLPMGEVMTENIFMIMPFDNELVLLEIKGSEMKKLLDVIAAKGGMPVGGVRMLLQATSWISAEFSGVPFSEDAHYILATSDYLANGGDGLDFLSSNVRYIKTGLLVRDIFISYINELTAAKKVINPKLDGRIRYE